jgi:hypothetical protein
MAGARQSPAPTVARLVARRCHPPPPISTIAIRHSHIAGLNRPQFEHELANVWIAAVSGLAERLVTDPPARVLDAACGSGWFPPGVTVDQARAATGWRLAVANEVAPPPGHDGLSVLRSLQAAAR